MSAIGRVESVWRYPVKSMRGEALPEIFAGFAGVYGDRIFAFKSSTARAAFPYWTARERHEMLLYRPRFRYPEKAAVPANLAEAEEISPLLNPVAADPATLRWMSKRRQDSCGQSMTRHCCGSSARALMTSIR